MKTNQAPIALESTLIPKAKTEYVNGGWVMDKTMAAEAIRTAVRELAPLLSEKTTAAPGLIARIDRAFAESDRAGLHAALKDLDMYAHEVCYLVGDGPAVQEPVHVSKQLVLF